MFYHLNSLDLVLILAIAAVIGGVGQWLTGYSLPNLLVSIVLGFLGALIGRWIHFTWMKDVLAFPVAGFTFPVIWSVGGATLLVLAWHGASLMLNRLMPRRQVLSRPLSGDGRALPLRGWRGFMSRRSDGDSP